MMLEIERAEGMYMYDQDGKAYMDLIAGISVSNLGHCHPKVVEAIRNQSKKYLHLMVYGELVQTPQVQLAELLSQHLPSHLQCTYFVNSGSEAVEGALKLAKKASGRSELIGFDKAYHGSTLGSLSLIGEDSFKAGFDPLLPGTKRLRFNNTDDLSEISESTAGVILEPVQGEAGVRIADVDWLQKLQARCKEHGALLIFDEVQTGIGRTGKLFAFEHHGIEPDILILAKAFGGGLPLGAFVASKELMTHLSTEPALGHISTFGGHPLSCAAALASLKEILESQLMAEVEAKGSLFKELLQHPAIIEIRSKGLMMAVHLKGDALPVVEDCVERGILVDWFLFASDCIRIAPPLIITREQIKEACKQLLGSIQTVYG